MGLFSTIADKIFHHNKPADPAATPNVDGSSTKTDTSASTPASSTPASASAEPVDVEAVLTDMASKKGGGGNWQSSIVDLLKLLDLDSSLQARKELGSELGVHAGDDGSAEQNMALHRAVMKRLAENGGKVPDSLKG